jgi:uncharacterized protein (TIGR03435 family)
MRTLALAFLGLSALAQDATAPAFEVASVRAVKPVNGMITLGGRTAPVGQIHFTQAAPRNLSRLISGNRFTMPTATLASLVMDAYNVKPSEFSGLPDWATDSDFYEITAKAEGEATLAPEQARLMLQTLLAERFQMKVHHEARNLPVYELTIAKNGTKLKEAPEDDKDGAPIRLIASIIQNFVDHPVVDKTGLTAPRYRMGWDQTELLDELKQGKPAPSIFHEVEAQLGLTLKAAKQATDFIVIDHVERLAEN